MFTRAYAKSWVEAHRVESAFIGTGLLIRFLFWELTSRRFEDGLITVTHARSVVDGHGLTHHPFEPVTHGFTSVVSVMTPLIGELFSFLPLVDGFLVLRLASLGAFVLTILAASAIAERLELGLWAKVYAYGFLTLSFNHIFYGMAGMETQIALAILLWAIVVTVDERPVASGILYGLCLLARPDFVIFVGIAVIWWAARRRAEALRVSALAGAVVAPWVIFATLYYGSPVANTITAKALRYPIHWPHTVSPGAWWDFISAQVSAREGWLWEAFSPFYEHVFVQEAPLLQVLATWIAGVMLLLAMVGLLSSWRNVVWRPVIAFVAVFFAYRLLALPASYYDWYYPPLTALVAIFGAVGLQRLSNGVPSFAPVCACALLVLFAWPLPALTVLEHRYQAEVEDQARLPLGLWFRDHVPKGSTVTSESAGYVGYYSAGNIKLLDYPGLTSRQTLRIMQALGEERNTLQWLIHAARPDYVVLRPDEIVSLDETFPDTFALYREVARFTAPVDATRLRWGGVQFAVPDREFIVCRRVAGRPGGVARAEMLVKQTS